MTRTPYRHALRRTVTIALAALLTLTIAGPTAAQDDHAPNPPKGYKALFNGKDLAGWRGLVKNVAADAKMSKEELAKAQAAANERMKQHWTVKDGVLVFDGKGKNLVTAREYGDFDVYIDWKIPKHADSGIYVRGQPQVQIWDPANPGQHKHGNQKGSGGLWNNKLPNNGKDPLVKADNPIGEWNTFRIRMIGLKISIWLNGKLIIDNATLENYWERGKPAPLVGPIELQNHGNTLYFRNLFIRELVRPDEAMKIEEAAPTEARVKPSKPRRVLAFIRAAGFRHSSIPHGAHAVDAMGRKTGAWTTDVSDDILDFLPDKLKQYDAVVLSNTTGNWLKPNGDDVRRYASAIGADGEVDPKKLEAKLRESFLAYVENGGGVAGFHSASDAFYQAWPEFGTRIIGGLFWGHPWHEDVGVKLEEPDHPLLKVFEGKDFVIKDEIYQFRDPYSRDNLRVLLKLDTSKTNMKKKGIRRTDGDFAVAWVRQQGKGRIFYSSLGHRNEIFWNPTIMQFYLDGIQYALGDLEADATPSNKVKKAALGEETSEPNLRSGTRSGSALAGAEGPKGDKGARMLFDGSDLDAWKFKKDGWVIEDGVMKLNPKGGYIWTKDAFDDFVLDLDFKVSKGCNSGIFFRSNPKNPVQGGFEIQVMDSHGKKTLGKNDGGAFYNAVAPSVNANKPAGEWNQFRLTCHGPHIKIELNGKTIVKADLDQWTTPNKNPDGSKNKFKTALKDLPRKGHIGFQDHGKPVWYRNVRVTPIR